MVAIWKSCFDESLDPGKKGWFVTAGVMATKRQWRRFYGPWRKALKERRPIPFFHMNNAMRLNDPGSVFYGWPKREVNRKIAALARVLVATSDYRAVTHFELEDFWHVMHRTQIDERYRDPYLLGFFQSCRLAAAHMSRLGGHQKKPILVFDHWSSTKEENRARELYDVFLRSTPDDPAHQYTMAKWMQPQALFMEDVADDIALQAADLVAWHYRDAFKKARRGEAWKKRRLLGRRIHTFPQARRREILLWKDALHLHLIRKRHEAEGTTWWT